VYSVDHGRVVAVPIERVISADAPHHVVVRVTLATGRVLEVSAPHPTGDGRLFGDLRAGGRLDGVPIVDARMVPFRFDRTYDILPASDTGTYYAAGVLVGSTLAPNAPALVSPSAPISCARGPACGPHAANSTPAFERP
jgi:hypothetical protein